MFDFFQGIETWKLVVGAIAAIALIWPRREAILAKLGGVFKFGGSTTSTTTTPDANAVAAAYRLLAAYMKPETAKTVRGEIAELLLAAPIPVAAEVAKVADSDTMGKLLSVLAELAAANTPAKEEAKP